MTTFEKLTALSIFDLNAYAISFAATEWAYEGKDSQESSQRFEVSKTLRLHEEMETRGGVKRALLSDLRRKVTRVRDRGEFEKLHALRGEFELMLADGVGERDASIAA